MKNLITSLKNLLSKLSGENIEGNNLVEVIDNGAKNITESQGQGSGSGVLMVTFTIDEENELEVLADHSLQDVVDAINAGIPIMGRMCKYYTDENDTSELRSTFSLFFIDYEGYNYDGGGKKPFATFAQTDHSSFSYDNELLIYKTNLDGIFTIFLTEEGPRTEPLSISDGGDNGK